MNQHEIVSAPATKRISAHSCINKGKVARIDEIFQDGKLDKNLISKLIHQNFLSVLFFRKTEQLNQIYKLSSYKVLSAWEAQQHTATVIDLYETNIKSYLAKYKSPLIELSHTIKKRKDNSTYVEIKKYHKRTRITRYIEFFLEAAFYENRKSSNKREDFQFEIQLKKESMRLELGLYKANKVLERVESLIKNLNKKIKMILYKKDSLFKAGQLTQDPLLIFDTENTEYQLFYRLKMKDKENLNIPLAFDPKYHGDFSEFKKTVKGKKRKNQEEKVKASPCPASLLQGQHLIYRAKGSNRFTISLSTMKNYEMLPTGKFIGIDVGGGSENHLASKAGIECFSHIGALAEKLKILDERKLIEGETEQWTKAFNKVFRENQVKMFHSIKQYLEALKADGYTDIIMEELSQFGKARGKNKETDIKTRRYFSLIRMSGLADMFKALARNSGMRVHTVPSFYSSKWCNKCSCIHDDNRKGKIFLCVNCGDSGHADIHAGLNLEAIFERFSEILCSAKNIFGEKDSKRFLIKERIKSLLTGFGY
jgi:transposase